MKVVVFVNFSISMRSKGRRQWGVKGESGGSDYLFFQYLFTLYRAGRHIQRQKDAFFFLHSPANIAS